MNSFANWFKARRLELKLCQEDVAERMGRSAATVSSIECGNVPRQKAKQTLIADALEVSADEVASRAASIPFPSQASKDHSRMTEHSSAAHS